MQLSFGRGFGATLSASVVACLVASCAASTSGSGDGANTSGGAPSADHAAPSGTNDAQAGDAGDATSPAKGDASGSACGTSGGDASSSCYAISCSASPLGLAANRDRLFADLARRKCTDACTLWGMLNQAERYIFLMDTAYLGAASSRIYPPSEGKLDTALDHATALYSINGPKAGQGVDASGRGGNDYNRIYLGFDALAACVMRSLTAANPTHDPTANAWMKSDDVAGPHAPFTQREMVFWYKAIYDLQSEGPQFHHWHADSDFDQKGVDQRLGVCGITDPTLVESTIAFDTVHSSDPLGDYSGRGGYGWQIVDQHAGVSADWSYAPSGCTQTAALNTDPYGGGTFNGMGPSLQGTACVPGWRGTGVCGP